MTGGHRMRVREPDMEGDDPGLHPEPDQGTKSQGLSGNRKAFLEHPEAVEAEIPREGIEEKEGDHDESGPDVGHDQVDETGLLGEGLFMFGDHQEIGDEGHHLIEDQEKEGSLTETAKPMRAIVRIKNAARLSRRIGKEVKGTGLGSWMRTRRREGVSFPRPIHCPRR